MTDRKSDDYEVGYGKPPRSGQFRPGQSGNPAGRKRRALPSEPKLPSFRPTQKLLRSEAGRLIAVRDGNRTYRVSTTEAVVRSLAQSALKGGVLAQRTYLALQQAEDARLAAEQEAVFNFWENDVAETKNAFECARKRGEPEPDLLPHPDDVILDRGNRGVRIVGPRDAEEARQCQILRARLELFFELMTFFGESERGMPSDDNPVYGAFTFMFATTIPLLPPRLRHIDETISKAILYRATGPRKTWIDYLNKQLSDLELDADVAKLRSRFIDLRTLNLRLGPGGFEYYRWPKRKILNPPSPEG